MNSTTAQLASRSNWGVAQIGRERYLMLAICVTAQAITILMTWSLWQVRSEPPMLPAIDLPQLPCGVLLLATLLLTLIRPRTLSLIHVGVLLVSFALDQYRTQPQVIALAVLICACCFAQATVVARWFLASLWLWSGLHKFYSPEWFGPNAHSIAVTMGPVVGANYWLFALAIAGLETLQGLLAIWRPRWAMVGCLILHFSIVIILSPLFYNWNVSVIPWNLCTAIVGAWILSQAAPGLPKLHWQRAVAAGLLILPAGFYVGWVDHGIASVLYSGHLPHGVVTHSDGVEKIGGIGELRIPFPNERRLLRQYFERAAEPGDKLHIRDPRRGLPDLYYLLSKDRLATPIDRARFLSSDGTEVAGKEYDDPVRLFQLRLAKVRLLRRKRGEMIYAAEIQPENYDPALLSLLAGLPNLEELQLAGCKVRDVDLQRLAPLDQLQGIGLDNTQVTTACLTDLAKHPQLKYIEHAQTEISDEEVAKFLAERTPESSSQPAPSEP